jgi:hypothetical protein|tara:strand:- start:559 stop:1125 length:567 start_codon:yes stop_codon:yes gene_type:complete
MAANLQLDIIVPPSYSVNILAVTDASIYPDSPPIVSAPTIEIEVPNFGKKILPFVPLDTNIFGSDTLGITEAGCQQKLPDGIYHLKYSIAPAYLNYVEKTIMRVDKLQEKFDNAFLQLDLMQCDMALKTQASVNLNTINFFIQGALASANNCAETEALKLYNQADNMLDKFLKSNCGCSGNNYVINFR